MHWKVTKLCTKFWQILNRPFKIAKVFQNFANVAKFRQISPHYLAVTCFALCRLQDISNKTFLPAQIYAIFTRQGSLSQKRKSVRVRTHCHLYFYKTIFLYSFISIFLSWRNISSEEIFPKKFHGIFFEPQVFTKFTLFLGLPGN